MQAVNTAELTPSSSDKNIKSQVQSAQSVLQVTLTGCDQPSSWQENPTPPPTQPQPPATWPTVAPPPVAPPAPQNIPSGKRRGCKVQGSGSKVPSCEVLLQCWQQCSLTQLLKAASVCTTAAAVVAVAVPGVTFAQAGSTLCGTGVCPTGQRCFDGWNCCPETTPICGGKCCQAPSTCVNNRCVEPGSVPCGNTVCQPGEQCGVGNVCCTSDRKVCGSTCCEVGQDCVLGTCAAAGSTACGATICAFGQTCVAGVCCNTGETACGGRCCPSGNTCLQVCEMLLLGHVITGL